MAHTYFIPHSQPIGIKTSEQLPGERLNDPLTLFSFTQNITGRQPGTSAARGPEHAPNRQYPDYKVVRNLLGTARAHVRPRARTKRPARRQWHQRRQLPPLLH